MTDQNNLPAIEQRLAERGKLREGITPGPWKVYPQELKPSGHENRIGTEWIHGQLKAPAPVVTLGYGVTEPNITLSIRDEDARFIAAAPTALDQANADVKWLVARVRELELQHEIALKLAVAEGVCPTSGDIPVIVECDEGENASDEMCRRCWDAAINLYAEKGRAKDE